MHDEAGEDRAERPTVFVVDDDTRFCKALVRLLKYEGLVAEAYTSSENFLESYRPQRPGCLLLDIRMPGIDGLELQAALAVRKVHIPIIFLSGQADVAMTIQAFKGGALDLLQKPVSSDDLLALIRKAIEEDAARRKKAQWRAAIEDRVRRLTPRERQVMQLVVSGMSSKEAARQLNVSHRTVEGHRLRVMEKMQSRSLAELIRMERTVAAKPLHS